MNAKIMKNLILFPNWCSELFLLSHKCCDAGCLGTLDSYTKSVSLLSETLDPGPFQVRACFYFDPCSGMCSSSSYLEKKAEESVNK